MKVKKADKIYFKKRMEFSKRIGSQELWSVIDQWPLFCGIGNLSRCLAISDLFRSTLSVPGHIAEFGSWKGANLLFLAKLLQIFDPQSSKKVHGFDSFQGLTEFTPKDTVSKKSRGQYKGSYRQLMEVIKLYNLTDDIAIHKGFIEKTLPKLLSEKPSISFSFVYCDTDLYQSTQLILDLLHPRLMKGGLFVFDEWNYDQFPGEGVAANEFMRQYGKHYSVEHISKTRQPSLALRKIRD